MALSSNGRYGGKRLETTKAENELVQFLIGQPSTEQIIAFHPSAEVAERAQAINAAELRELETFMYIEHMMRLMKAAAHKALQQKAS